MGHMCTVKLWSVADGQCLHTLTGHGGAVYACDFAPHGKTIVSASGDATLKLWDVASGTWQAKKTLRGHSGSVFAVAWSINGLLASGSYDKTVKIWNPSADECLKTLHCSSGMVFACEFAPDGKTLASGSQFHIQIWDVWNWPRARRH